MRRRFILFPVTALVVGSFAFFGAETLPAHSTENTAMQPQASIAPSPAPTATSSPSPTPTQTTQATATVVSATPAAAPAKTTPAIKGNSLSIPSIGFQAQILEVGLTLDNAIDVPAGSQVGHWNGSAQPGMSGLAFLDGHLGGVFAQLSRVGTGQIISVNYSGQTYNYQVVYTEVVPLAGIDMGRALSVYGGGSEGLNLMTCAGTYIASQGTYDHRLVVYTVRV